MVWALDLEAVLAGALTLQMAMPCAVVSYMYARRYTDLGDTPPARCWCRRWCSQLLAPLMLWFSHGH